MNMRIEQLLAACHRSLCLLLWSMRRRPRSGREWQPQLIHGKHVRIEWAGSHQPEGIINSSEVRCIYQTLWTRIDAGQIQISGIVVVDSACQIC